MGFQQLLVKMSPRFIARWFSRPYIAGETAKDALATCDQLHRDHQIHATIDLLGEYVHSTEEVARGMAEYERLLPQLAERPYTYPSVKLSALGQSVDEDLCRKNAEELVTVARDINQFIAFDMEDHTTVDSTLNTYRWLRDKGFDNIGIVLQSRLKRTPDDIAALADYQPNARICIGIYREPAEVAETDKPKMKDRLIEQLGMMLKHGYHPNVATHDETVIARARKLFDDKKWPRDKCEFQMLLGVPRAKLQRDLIGDGYTVRLYVPYGEHWYPYSMRRIDENPGILWQVLGNVFSRKGRL